MAISINSPKPGGSQALEAAKQAGVASPPNPGLPAKPLSRADRFQLIKNRAPVLTREVAPARTGSKETDFFSALSVAFFLYIRDQQLTLENFLGPSVLGASRDLPIVTGSESGESTADEKGRGKTPAKRAPVFSVKLTPGLARKISSHRLSLQEAIPVAQALSDYFEKRRDRLTASDIIDAADACFGGRLLWDRRLKALRQFLRDPDPDNKIAKAAREGKQVWILVSKPVRVNRDGIIDGDLLMTAKKPKSGAFVELHLIGINRAIIEEWEGEAAAALVTDLVHVGFWTYRRKLPGTASIAPAPAMEGEVPSGLLPPRAKEVMARLLETGVLQLKFSFVDKRKMKAKKSLAAESLELTKQEVTAVLDEINRVQLTDTVLLLKNLLEQFIPLNSDLSPETIQVVLMKVLEHLQREKILSFEGFVSGTRDGFFKVMEEFQYDKVLALELARWIAGNQENADLEIWLGALQLEKPTVGPSPLLRAMPEPPPVPSDPKNPLAIIRVLSDFKRHGPLFLTSSAKVLFGNVPERFYVTADNTFPIEGRHERVGGQLELRDKLPEDRPWAKLAWVDGAVMYALDDYRDSGQKITEALVWAGLAVYSWSYHLGKIRDLDGLQALAQKGGRNLLVEAVAQLYPKAAAEPFFVSAREGNMLLTLPGLEVSAQKPANGPFVKMKALRGKPTLLEAAGEPSTQLGELLAENGLAEWGDDEGAGGATGKNPHSRPFGHKLFPSVWARSPIGATRVATPGLRVFRGV